MRFIIFAILALLSLFLIIICFGYLLASCAGHPPTDAIGIWILPVSFLGAGTFLYLSLFFWKARRPQPVALLTKEAKSLPKKISIFLSSFLVATFSFFVLSGLIMVLAIKTTMPDWTAYIIYPMCTGLAIYAGVGTYKYMIRKNEYQINQGDGE